MVRVRSTRWRFLERELEERCDLAIAITFGYPRKDASLDHPAMTASQAQQSPAGQSLVQTYRRVRARSLQLCEPLTVEDMTIQSMPDASPSKWHLAHVSWFFEQFVLRPNCPGYEVFDESYHHLFNSYYNTAGSMHPRPLRGLLSRPSVEEIFEYRSHVDAAMDECCTHADTAVARLIALGIHHEQQHQELLLTDIKHLLAQHPGHPPYDVNAAWPGPAAGPMGWRSFAGGLRQIGAGPAEDFEFDNELPRHRIWLDDFELATRPVTNGEYLDFIADGGYRRSDLWLADGWSAVHEGAWHGPLYWQPDNECVFTLGGLRAIDHSAPVCHLSFYEADAYARWANARLPTEAEWETAVEGLPLEGHFVESGALTPRGCPGNALRQCFGDVWEWTGSPYTPYPGFRPLNGSLGEYNGKFMSGQMVLRGGSCATPAGHVRASYRNFFYPWQRWQFSGLRLARSPS